MSKSPKSRLLNRVPSSRPPRSTLADAQQQTRRSPNDARGWKDFAQHLLNAGQLEEARQAAERARELAADDAAAWVLSAEIAAKEDEDRLAIVYLNKAIELKPDSTKAHHVLAGALLRVNNIDDALKHSDLAYEYEPTNGGVLAQRALILLRHFRYAEATELLQGLIKKDPRNTFAYLTNLGNALRDIGRLAESEDAYLKAVQLQPADLFARSNLLTLMHYMPQRTAAEIEQACRAFGTLFAQGTTGKRPAPADLAPNKRLRVGMFSDGFRQHPVGAMTATALEQLVKQGVELYLYSTTTTADYITKRLMNMSTRWQHIASLTDEQFTQQVKDDEIDILIDLAGYGAGTRMQVMAHEPAPLLIKWVGGLINTTGIENIDYLISDAVESPPGSDSGYAEKLIRMPDDYICYMPPARVPDVAPLPALAKGHVTFGCFNNPTKINPVLLAEWAQLLNAVPESRLLLKSGPYDSPVMQKMVTDVMLAHGVQADRIQFSGQSLHYQLFAAYNEIDVALDPWPYSGGLTTCEAMLMGVPVVTLPGPTFAGRHSATHLVNAGMPELVAADWDEYRARAIELVSNLDSLATIRGHLRETLLKSPVCDGTRFAGHLANAMRAIWQRYCEGKAPAALHLSKDGTTRFEGDEAPVKLLQPALPPEEAGFKWQLPRKLIAVDSGSRLLDHASTEGMLSLKMLETVVFDPTASHRDHVLVQREDVHYQLGVALGDGQPATLHDCLDPKLSGLLKPLDADSADPTAGARVLLQRQLPTIALDNINGLPAVDWLLLDGDGASANILAHGAQALAHTLLIDARVVFQPTHAGQPTLAEVDLWAGQHGFRLHRLHTPQLGHMSELSGSQSLPPTALLHADALYIPDATRLAQLDAGRRQKLACILHMGYGLEDVAYEVLAGDLAAEPQAQDYLDDRHIAKAVQRDTVIGVHNARNLNEAVEAVQVGRALRQWKQPALQVMLKRCLSMLEREKSNDTAHFLLVHALLAQGPLVPSDEDSPRAAELRELSVRLHAVGWPHKGTLYSHWLEQTEFLNPRMDATVSAVLVVDGSETALLANLQALREQGEDAIEIVLVSKGASIADNADVLPLVDAWIETRADISDYVARNLGVVYTHAPVLLFLDANGTPEAGLMQAHLDAYREYDAIAVRGSYRLRKGSAETPAPYSLGDEVLLSLPSPVANVSFSRTSFTTVGGWGDYILTGPGGIDIGNRLINKGEAQTRQIYTPHAVLRLDRDAPTEDKFAKQRAPWMLLEAFGTTRVETPSGDVPTPGSEARMRPDNDDGTRAQVIGAPELLLRDDMHRLVCVGVPIYNEEKYIEQTIRSLKYQDVDDVRFLVCDNVSTDRTLEIVLDTVGSDSRFTVFQHPKNLGSLNNFRFAFENSASDYFMWLGGHDFLSPGYLAAAQEKLNADPELAMVCGQPHGVMEAAVDAAGAQLIQGAVYEFDQPSAPERYMKSVAELANCTIIHSLFRRAHAAGFDMREVVSWDHVFISRLLWKGRLAYLEREKYYRRYFKAREQTSAERLTGNAQPLSNADFVQHYQDDLKLLQSGALSATQAAKLRSSLKTVLLQRFGA
jgi:protein O-GlcNAc transferase